MRRYVCVALLLGLCAAGSAANAGTSGKPVTWQFDLGYVMVQGKPSDVFEDGWSFGFGAVLRPYKKPIAWRFDTNYTWFDVNTGNIDLGAAGQILVDDGDGSQWSVRSGIQYEQPGDHAKFIGGVGIGAYRLHANLTQEVLVPGYICDPYYWWYCYYGYTTGDVILADKTLTKFGYYATAGVVFPLTNSDIYVELQYDRVNVEKYFETIPFVVGWRF